MEFPRGQWQARACVYGCCGFAVLHADRFSGCSFHSCLPCASRRNISCVTRESETRAVYRRRTCIRRLLAVGVTLESTETICNKDDICGRARVGRPPLRRYESATRDRLEVVREWASVMLCVGRTRSYRCNCASQIRLAFLPS